MPLTEDGNVNTTAQNIANGDVNFGEMTFTQDMVGKTFGYKITEVLPQDVTSEHPTWNGLTYDTSEKIVKVTVTDDGQGNVVATVTPNDGEDGVVNNFTFTNTYEPTSIVIGDETNAGIQVQKTLSGRDWENDESFTFTLTPVDNAPMPEGEDNDILTLTKPASGNVQKGSFGKITFDEIGVYKYQISEELPDGVDKDHPSKNGITYDTHVTTATVTVTEENGQLKADIAYTDGNVAAFTNTYSTTAFTGVPTSFNFTKELVGRDWTKEDVFTFTLTGLEGAPMPEGSNEQTKTIEVTKDTAQDFDFGTITYTQPGNYQYQVVEKYSCRNKWYPI